MGHNVSRSQKPRREFPLNQKNTNALLKRNKINVLHHGSMYSKSPKKIARQGRAH